MEMSGCRGPVHAGDSAAPVARRATDPHPRITAPRFNSRARGGFTLIELIAVLIIIAFASALAVPAFRSFVEPDDMTKATRRIEALFRLARDSAVHSGAPVTVVIDSVSSKVWFDVPSMPDLDAAFADTTVTARGSRSRSFGLSALRTSTSAADHVVPGESLELPESIRLAVTRARARFEFGPSGAAFPDTLFLRSTLGDRMITVDRWTGDILVF